MRSYAAFCTAPGAHRLRAGHRASVLFRSRLERVARRHQRRQSTSRGRRHGVGAAASRRRVCRRDLLRAQVRRGPLLGCALHAIAACVDGFDGHLYTHAHTHTHTHSFDGHVSPVYVCMYVCMHVCICMYLSMYVSIYVCMLCVCVCVFVCVCVYVHTHTQAHTLFPSLPPPPLLSLSHAPSLPLSSPCLQFGALNCRRRSASAASLSEHSQTRRLLTHHCP